MLFALYDYLHYRRRSGRYERTIRKSSLMGGAFEGSLPETVLTILQSGDVLFVETFDSIISWAIMYLTNSHISHVAWYMGNRSISHATKNAGVVIEPVEALFDSSTRILPCVWHMPDETRLKIEAEIKSNWLNYPYSTKIVIIKGLKIILGRDWPEYRWVFLFDFLLLLVVLDLPIFLYFGFPILTLIIPIYLLTLLINRNLSNKNPVPLSYPNQWLNWLRNSGKGEFLLDAYHVSKELKKEKIKHGE